MSRFSLGCRRALVLLSAVVPVLAGAAASAAPAQSAPSLSESRTAEPGIGSERATVTINSVSPAAPTPTGSVTIRGTVTNDGDSPIVGSSVSPRQAVELSGRRAIDDAVTREGFDLVRDGALVRDHSVDIDTVPPGLSRSFTLRVPVSELELDGAGVYQVALSLTGQTETEQWDQVLGIGRTLLPWVPDADELPDEPGTQLTVLWPLISTTHLNPQTDESQVPILSDDALLTEISPGGRLYQMVSLGADLPVTWVVDPDLLASVDAMAEDYQVQGSDGPIPGRGQEVARNWLLQLQEAVEDSEVVALPFADPDLASLAHQGKDVPGSLGQLRDATRMAGPTVETVLGVEANTDFAWPVDGALDPDIVSVATSASAGNIISRSDSITPTDALPYTPSAPRPIGGGVTALVADNRLSQLFQADMSRPGNVSRAHQLLLAHTLAIHGQDPELERSILVAPQRMPTTAQVQAMAEALRSLENDGDWVRFIDLSEAAESKPDPAANNQVPPASQYPQELREQELPTHAFQTMRETRRTLNDFSVILSEPDRVVSPFGSAIQREMSTSWRDRESAGARYRSSVQNQLVQLTEQVQLIPKSTITLSGRSATIPVTVQNNLLQDVEGLELRLTSSRRLGLDVSGPQSVTIGGGHSQSVKFEANSRANGNAYLEAQLYTPDGKPYGESMRFKAQVTSITSTVLMVIGVGMLLVVLAGVRMYTQRKRMAARQPDTGAGATAIEDETPAEDENRSDSDTGGDAGNATDADTPAEMDTADDATAEPRPGRGPAGESDSDTGGADPGGAGGSEKLDRSE
ncbi:DUF6049 family protein [Streptomyces otsuchiensis]|uniref:DUF6049 family protein n=1 Tax=Streptomyces otsuchiensis TaxID=2681388 RepID=UPI0010323645|nr:DUF6049 family protein [Streptomyces otsuchiensis]